MRELPSVAAMFAWFALKAGGEQEARYRFQRLVQDLVASGQPGVSEVAYASGSDWGIDTCAGTFDQSLLIWQSKFFTVWTVGDTQRKQVRDSFAEVIEKAKEKEFKIASWTLSVPCILPPIEQQWFDNWAVKMRRTHGFQIHMWSGSEIRRRLQLPDNDRLYDRYFGGLVADGEELPDIADLEDPSELAGALFVKQLEAAGHLETDAAKGLYFAAEALARDVLAQGSKPRIEALKEMELEAHGTWERHFNAARPGADANGQMSGLVDTVTTSVATIDSPVALPLRAAHKKGLMHRLVERAKAGWVTDWRQRAQVHGSGTVADVLPVAGLVDPNSGEND